MSHQLPNLRPALIAAAALLTALLLAFLLPRFLLPHWPILAPKFFLGWIAALFLLTTVANILWTARANSFTTAFVGYAFLTDSAAVLLLILGLTTGLLRFPDILRLYLLLLTWSAAWSAFTYLLRRRPPLAAAVAITCSAIFFAAPITALPLARASSHRENTLQFISYATPILPAFDAVRSSLPAVGWPEWPVMYRLSDISQEIALRARWHRAALIYAVVAGVHALACYRRRHAKA